MIRNELLDKLSLIAPALARTDFIPVLCHVWFSGSTIMAYNDVIGISSPLKTDFIGGVNGEVFNGMLRQSKAKDIELVGTETELQVKAGATSKFKLPVLDLGKFEESFTFPKRKEAQIIKIAGGKAVMNFLGALGIVMHSVSNDSTLPDQMGVTCIPDDEGVTFYSTKPSVMSRAHITIAGKVGWNHRVILPAQFCQTVLDKFAGTKEAIELEVYPTYVMAYCEGMTVWSRVITAEKPFNFPVEMEDSIPAKLLKRAVPIPSKLKSILDRHIIIAADKKGKARTKVSTRDAKMFFHTLAPDRGEANDNSQIEEGHPDIMRYLDAELFRIGFDAYYNFDENENGKMILTDNCLAFTRGKMVYALSNHTNAK